MLFHSSIAILLEFSSLCVTHSLEIYPEDEYRRYNEEKCFTRPKDPPILHSAPLLDESQETRNADEDKVSFFTQAVTEVRGLSRNLFDEMRSILIAVLRYLLRILDPIHPESNNPRLPETFTPDKEERNPVTIEVDSYSSSKYGDFSKKMSASDESLDKTSSSRLFVEPSERITKPRRSSVSSIGSNDDHSSSEKRTVPRKKSSRQYAALTKPNRINRNRSASATPSSPRYAAPTASSMNMRSPTPTGRRSAEILRRKKHLEFEREEKLDDIRKRNRSYKDDVLRQLEEQQEERAKYVEEIKKNKQHPNKLSKSIH